MELPVCCLCNNHILLAFIPCKLLLQLLEMKKTTKNPPKQNTSSLEISTLMWISTINVHNMLSLCQVRAAMRGFTC